MLFSNLKNTNHSIKELDLPRDILHVKLQDSIKQLQSSAALASDIGLKVAAGHGLNYQNVKTIANISEVIELNIGQSIIARSIFTGFESAVREMVDEISY
jgi:pyridoxine 5-phosphate synthase